jgi:hypothetical protein
MTQHAVALARLAAAPALTTDPVDSQDAIGARFWF